MHTQENTTHTFRLILTGQNPLEEHNLDRLFMAGCDDAIFGQCTCCYMAEFNREAASFSLALISAIMAVEGAIDGLRVSGVEAADFRKWNSLPTPFDN